MTILEVELLGGQVRDAEVVVRAVCEDGRPAVEARAAAPGTVTIPLGDDAAGRAWSVEAETPGLWAPAVTVVPSEEVTTVRLDVGPAAPVRFRLVAHDRSSRPSEVTVGLGVRPTVDREPAPVERRCEVSETGEVACQLPTGAGNLRIRADGFLSAYRWSSAVPPAGLDLGEIRLTPGASLVARVVDPGGRPVEGALVSLDRPGGLQAEVATNAAGFAVFAGIDPGMWRVRAAKEGWAGSAAPPVRVVERAEATVAEPLELSEPTLLSVRLSPPAPPGGGSWLVAVQGLGVSGSAGELNAPEATDPDGWVHFVDLPARTVELIVRDPDGGLWLRREVDPVRAPQPVEVRLGNLEVAGRVVRGPELRSGEIRFMTLPAATSPRYVSAPVDESGRFRLSLPEPGRWRAVLEGRGNVTTPPLEVLVEAPAGDGPVELELEFPSAELRGIVVDEAGSGEPEVQLTAVLLDGDTSAAPVSATATTDSDGRFRIPAVPDGELRVLAAAADGRQADVGATVDHGRCPPELRIVLPSERMLRGRLIAGGRAVAGATVLAMPAGSGFTMLSPVQTDGLGRFEVTVASPGSVALAAFTPGGPIVLDVVEVAPHEVVIAAPTAAGSLELAWEPSRRSQPLVGPGAARWPVQVLAMFGAGSGATFADGRAVLPALGAGQYDVCSADLTAAAPSPRCRPVDVVPFGTTEIDLGTASNGG